jgi:hypothetical protein
MFVKYQKRAVLHQSTQRAQRSDRTRTHSRALLRACAGVALSSVLVFRLTWRLTPQSGFKMRGSEERGRGRKNKTINKNN